MKKLLLSAFQTAIIVASLFSFNNLNAQAWQWANGGGGTASDNASRTCVDPFGNVFVAGSFNSISIQIGTITVNNSAASGFDVYVAKYNSAGVALWAARIGGSSAESVSGISCDNAGRVYVGGHFNSPNLSLAPLTNTNAGSPKYNVYVACIDAGGITQWLTSFGGPSDEWCGGLAYSMGSSGVYITGTYFDPTLTIGTTTLNNTSLASNAEIYVAKFTNSGVLSWAKSTGSSGAYDWGYGIAVDATGAPAIFGTYAGSVVAATTTIGTQALTSYGNQDLYIAKYNNAGTFQWARGLGSSGGGDFTGGIEADGLNNYYLSGTYQSASMIIGTTTLTPYGNYDAFIAKYNSSGTAQWAQKIGGASDDYGYGMTVDFNNNAYITGTFTGTLITVGTNTLANTVPGPSSDIFVAKYSPLGVEQWATSAGGAGNEGGSAIASTTVGDVYVVGNIGGTSNFGTYTVNSLGGNDLYVAKIGCLTTLGGGISNVCQGLSTTLTASGATTYSWSTGASTSSILITPTVSGVYTATGTTGACVGTPATFSVTFLPASLSAGSNLNMLCKQTAVINATCNPASPTSVVWSPATNLSSASILNPTVTSASGSTNYTVTTTLSNGCVKVGTVTVSSYAQTPDICQVTVDSLGNNNEIYWEKTLYPQADSFIVYRETSASVYTRIAGVSRTLFSMYTDTNRSIGPFNGNPNLTYYRYKLQIKDSCGNVSPMSLWHETIFVQDQLNGNFNWNSYAIELSASPVSSYNLKRRDVATGTETLVVSTGGNLATDPQYNTFWPLNVKWFVDAIGFNCVPSLIIKPSKYGMEIAVTKTKTKSNQSNDKLASTSIANNTLSSVIRVYPNPAKDVLNVDLNSLQKTETDVEIQNVFGQIIYQTKALNQYLVINTNSFAAGVYFVNIKQNNKVIAIKKVVVEN